MIGEGKSTFKFFWKGQSDGQGGVGILVKEELANEVVEVRRISERVISVKIKLEHGALRVVSVYAPQVNRTTEEKEEFWKTLETEVRSKAKDEKIIIAGDFNGHVGQRADGFQGIHGDKGFGERNAEGLQLLEFAEAADLVITNTVFEKPEKFRATYKSGENETQVDYMLTAHTDRKNVRNVQVVKNEECVKQHRLLIMDWRQRPVIRRPTAKIKRIKTWRLKEDQVRKAYTEHIEKVARLTASNVDIDADWELFKGTIIETARTVCGQTQGIGRKGNVKIWNDELKAVIKKKRQSYLTWQKSKRDEDKAQYYKDREEAKQTVRKTVQTYANQLADRLQTGNSQSIYKYIQNEAAKRVDIGQMRQVKDRNGRIQTKEEEILKTWTEHMKQALNIDNTSTSTLEPAHKTEGPELPITVEEVKIAMSGMKTGKAAGKSGVSTEMLKPLGERALGWLTRILNRIWKDGQLPLDWRTGIIIPIYKGKGDPLDCNSY